VLKVGRLGFDSLAESGQKTSKVGIYSMLGVGSDGQGGAVALLGFYKVEGSLKGH